MDLAELWAEIESDYKWRSDEIRFFQNQLTSITVESDKNQFRRAIILILYAHFEGFSKFAFTLYVSAINRETIKCKDANFAIAAAALSDLFDALKNPDKKCEEFRTSLPDDEKLHRFARQRDFIEYSNKFDERIVVIPDKVVDTESNLKPVVLRKNLYRLGFPYDSFIDIEGDIHLLINFRNKIAHGDLKDGIKSDELEKGSKAAFRVMTEIKQSVMQALTTKRYLRAS